MDLGEDPGETERLSLQVAHVHGAEDRDHLRVVEIARLKVAASRECDGSSVTYREKLDRLRRRIVVEQRRMVLAAAEVDTLPSSTMLAKLSDLELAIAAVEAAIEDGLGGRP